MTCAMEEDNNKTIRKRMEMKNTTKTMMKREQEGKTKKKVPHSTSTIMLVSCEKASEISRLYLFAFYCT